MRPSLVLGAAAALALLLACRETARPTAAATSDPTPPPTPPASPPGPTPAPASRADAIESGGGLAPLSRDGETVIDPASSFEVELAGRIADARLVLLDGADAHVAATGAREIGATTRLALAPSAPLVPGSRYVLRVEGTGAREMHGDGGLVHVPISFALLVAGTPPPPEPKRKPKRRRR